MPNALHELARRLPKAELHVHLEGSIQPATLLELARQNGQPLPAEDEASLRAYYTFTDFTHFLNLYITILKCLRAPQDYRLIAYEFGRECARQNIRYAEVTFTMISNVYYSGLSWQAILDGLNQGRAEAGTEFGVRWGWIFDIVRDRPDLQMDVVEMALAGRDQGVVALGLAGDERMDTAVTFQPAFEAAAAAGLPRVPHTGELSGPDKIWEVIRHAKPHRLQHGVRAVEDPMLVAELRDQGIGVDLCPTSNIRLGVYPDYASHPLRQLWDAGLLVTVNSDDPPLFNTDLNAEYAILGDHFGFTADEYAQVSLNGVRASLLPEDEKVRLEAEFREEIVGLRAELGV